jgi:hypothetical protein
MALPAAKWSFIDRLLCLIFAAALVYVEVGFFRPDPLLYQGSGAGWLRYGLWAMRAAVPLLGAALLCLYYLCRTGRLPLSAVGIIGAGALLALLIAYPIAAEFYYGRISRDRLSGYHSILQLAPPDYASRDEAGGPPAFHVVCLGGSTTAWPDSRGRDWPALVEDLLADRAAKNQPYQGVRVHNLGKEWYTSLHSLINYAVNLRQHRPNMIVIMHAVNDLLDNADFSQFSHAAFREDYGHFLGPAARLLKRKSLVGNLAEKIAGAWYHTPRKSIAINKFPGIAPFRRNLSTLIDLAALDGAQVVLMTEPNLFKDAMSPQEQAAAYLLNQAAVGADRQWAAITAKNGMQQYNDAIRELARSRGAALIDLDAEIPRSLEYFTDEVHYQDRTFPMVAEKVANKLAGIMSVPQDGARGAFSAAP